VWNVVNSLAIFLIVTRSGSQLAFFSNTHDIRLIKDLINLILLCTFIKVLNVTLMSGYGFKIIGIIITVSILHYTVFDLLQNPTLTNRELNLSVSHLNTTYQEGRGPIERFILVRHDLTLQVSIPSLRERGLPNVTEMFPSNITYSHQC